VNLILVTTAVGILTMVLLNGATATTTAKQIINCVDYLPSQKIIIEYALHFILVKHCKQKISASGWLNFSNSFSKELVHLELFSFVISSCNVTNGYLLK
jgi:hypothetical protein